MNKRTICLTLTAVVFLLTALADQTYGCSCYAVSPCEAYGKAKAVFVGKMIGGTEKNILKGLNGERIELEAGEVRFEVEEAFKGVTGKEIIVFLNSNKRTSCEWGGYRPGERYLIFASEYNGRLTIGACNPSVQFRPTTRPENKTKTSYRKKYDRFSAEAGLAFLRGLPADKSLGRLTVVVTMGEDGVAGIPITALGPDKTKYESMTDEIGEGVFENLKPGLYSVSADWPKEYVGLFHQPVALVTEQSCSEVPGDAIYSGAITGKVVDEHHQPAQSIRVYAIPVSPSKDGRGNSSGVTDKDGKFAIGALSAGNYRLYIKSASKGTPNYYYPGVSSPEQAIEIIIGKGDIREDVEFKLPPMVETQTIRGKVVWPDGRPAVNAWVYLECPVPIEAYERKIEIPGLKTETDANGEFSLSAIRGASYSIKAILRTGPPNIQSHKDHVHSPLMRLTLSDKPIEVRLILSGTTYGPDCRDEKKQN